MTRDTDERLSLFISGARVPESPHIACADVIGAEVNAVSVGGDGDVSAGIDQQSSLQFSFLSPQLIEDADRFVRQRFQFSSREIFFAELDVVDASSSGFGEFLDEKVSAGGFVGGEGGAIGDVVEKSAVSHQLSAIL